MSESFYEHLFGVRGKVALVTGGTRGIGLMIAEGLVRGGARVYVSSRKEDACAAAETSLSEYGECIAIPCDIGNLEGCERLAGEIAAREERLNLLVNNAGLTWSAPIDEFTEKAWDRVVDLDVKSPFFLTQKLLPLLRAAASPEARSCGQHLVFERYQAQRVAELLLCCGQSGLGAAECPNGARSHGRLHQRQCHRPGSLQVQDDGAALCNRRDRTAGARELSDETLGRDGRRCGADDLSRITRGRVSDRGRDTLRRRRDDHRLIGQ